MSYRIIHVVSSLHIGGAERFVLDLAPAQISQGHRVEIVSFGTSDEPLNLEAQRLQLTVRCIDRHRHRGYRQIWSILDASGPTILHIHSPAALKYFVLMMPILRLKGIQMVYTRHGCRRFSEPYWKLAHKLAGWFVGQATFVSKEGQGIFADVHRWQPHKLHLIQNGVVLPPKPPTKPTAPPLRLGSVGRIVRLKGQTYLLQALSLLPQAQQQDLVVHIYGDGPLAQDLQTQARQQLPQMSIQFHGMVLDRDQVFDSIDVLVVCSETEGLSLAIMEAMARGIPIIATSVGDNAKLVIPGKTGILFEFANIQALADAITQLQSQPDLRQQLAWGAREHIQTQYSMAQTCQAYQQCYQRLFSA